MVKIDHKGINMRINMQINMRINMQINMQINMEINILSKCYIEFWRCVKNQYLFAKSIDCNQYGMLRVLPYASDEAETQAATSPDFQDCGADVPVADTQDISNGSSASHRRRRMHAAFCD